VTEHDVPQDRDLPAGRLAKLKDELMAQIEHDLEIEPPTAPEAGRRRWRRIAVTAAAVAAGFGIATPLVLGGEGTASANTAMRTANGDILITIREGKHPKELERRLNDLGVPAVVDFLESGYGCNPARSTGWVEEPPGEDLFTWAPDGDGDGHELVLDPDELPPGQIPVFEFQIDEAGGEVAANVTLRTSTSEVGPCVPVRNASIVDAERGVAGG
jgi:hypothetical protein